MTRILASTLVLMMVLAGNLQTGFCQQQSPSTNWPQQSTPNSHAVKIRHQLEFIGFGQDITVRRRHGDDYHGRLVTTADNDFKLDEVDLQPLVSINYGDVKRIDRGYRPKNLIGGKRNNPHTSKIIAIVALGGLGVLLAVAGLKAGR